MTSAIPGARALHRAVWCNNTELVGWLLFREHEDPNLTDYTGCTPLFWACQTPRASMDVVSLLLRAGADPALTNKHGFTPMHAASSKGRVDIMDMLYLHAPATLNQRADGGGTPLLAACLKGDEKMVSKLLSMGAMERTYSHYTHENPLVRAVALGFVHVVRVLVNEGGVRAVGGEGALPSAMRTAAEFRQPMILRLLLTMCGEERRAELANIKFEGKPLIHCCASYCYPAAINVLLKAGADEAALTADSRIPGDVIGPYPDQTGSLKTNPRDEVAIRRMLDRGPAFRARSWAWPLDSKTDAGGTCNGEGDTTPPAAAAAAAILSSRLAMTPPEGIVVQIARSRDKNSSSSKFFVTSIGRYCLKN